MNLLLEACSNLWKDDDNVVRVSNLDESSLLQEGRVNCASVPIAAMEDKVKPKFTRKSTFL